ncbi:MAG: DUF805 domain-containing protein [Bacillus sp. (in: firmicutes)]
MKWYLKVLKNYVEFSGRARRKEYWMFALINAIILLCINLTENFVGVTSSIVIISLVYNTAVLIPSIAVTVRRLHDAGFSGWVALIILIPVLGWIAIIIFMLLDSAEGSNKYGPNPKTTQSSTIAS